MRRASTCSRKERSLLRLDENQNMHGRNEMKKTLYTASSLTTLAHGGERNIKGKKSETKELPASCYLTISG